MSSELGNIMYKEVYFENNDKTFCDYKFSCILSFPVFCHIRNRPKEEREVRELRGRDY